MYWETDWYKEFSLDLELTHGSERTLITQWNANHSGSLRRSKQVKQLTAIVIEFLEDRAGRVWIFCV